MSLADITADAVRQALAECDEIGREAFLHRYGFGEPRSYFIEHNGLRYPAKAIMGAAHGYARPDLGPLQHAELKHSKLRVREPLKKWGFTVVNTAARNPTWRRDELILALDFYIRHHDYVPDKASKEIVRLSDNINAVARSLGLSGSDSFRNSNGVYMKLMNFRRFDPEYTGGGKVGLSRGGRGDEEVWNEFADHPERLHSAADLILAALSSEQGLSDTETELPDIAEAPEGRLVTRMHQRRERSRKLVKAKNRAFMKAHGRVYCEACGFDFERAYGPRGNGFIECHHTKPVHTLDAGAKTKLDDLVLLCANCHRMVHAKAPWLSMVELQRLLTGGV